MAGGAARTAWQIHFFETEEAGSVVVPTVDFLDSLPAKVAAEIHAVLDAVAGAPPPSFSGGGKWEAMNGKMAGVYEIRAQGGGKNHRLFCLLVRNGETLGAPAIVCLGGLTKPRRSAADDRDYKRILKYKTEFESSGRVMG